MASPIELVFPDQTRQKFPGGITGRQVAEKIGSRLALDALAVELNGTIFELERPLTENGEFRVLTWKDLDGKKALWHTASHVLAEAVHELYPNALPTIGPPIDDGFYYDFDVEQPFNEEDLQKIEQKMLEIFKKNRTIVRHDVTKEEALKKFGQNAYKQELIEEFVGTGKKLSIYSQGQFFDLCKGGHVEQTGKIKAVKLIKTGGAYWRGSEKNKMLQRIYGIAFPEQKMQDEWLKAREEAEKRSHLRLGKELDLFSISPLVGKGLPLWHPKGAWIRHKLEEFMREEQFSRGYQMVVTPHLANKRLYEISGHYPYYKDTMYAPIDIEGEEYLLKPMNCPFHIQIYASRRRSYRELPVRLGEFGTVYRFEKSGELTGLLRVRGLTQDDAHLFVTQEQIPAEFGDIFDLVVKALALFGISDFRIRLGTRDPESTKYIGSAQNWEKAETGIENVLKEKKIPYSLEKGEAAFYGPKADIIVKDSLGREWQLGTIQLDYNLPERFDLNYIGSDDQPHRPVIIHRAPFGSLERFTAILIEHYKGAFPPWISPNPIRILPLSDKFAAYAKTVQNRLKELRIISELDESNNTLSYKVRQAQLDKVPIMVVVGEREEKENTVTVRLANGKQIPDCKLDGFIQKTVEIMQKRQTNFLY
ncbi:MAG: threonine--tRNA ligase [Candidatus Micrarchaeota archaeon]